MGITTSFTFQMAWEGSERLRACSWPRHWLASAQLLQEAASEGIEAHVGMRLEPGSEAFSLEVVRCNGVLAMAPHTIRVRAL